MSEASETNVSIKQRLVGAIVLVSLGVIFLPMMLDGDGPFDVVKREKFIPEEPQLRQVFDVKQAELSRLAAGSESKSVVAKTVAKSATKPVVAKESKTPVSKQLSRKSTPSTDISEQESEPFSVSIVDRISEEALKISALLSKTISEESKETGSNKNNVADLNKDVAPASKASKDKDVATLSKPAKMIQKLKNNNEKTVKTWAVQLGSFKTKPNAFKLRDRLRTKGFPSYVESVKTKKGASYRVRVGPENLLTGAENLKLKLSKVAKLNGIIVRH